MSMFECPSGKDSHEVTHQQVTGIHPRTTDFGRAFTKPFKVMLAAFWIGSLGGGLITSSAHAGEQDEQDKPTTLTFKYTGDSCDSWSNAQSTEAFCIDYLEGASEVRIVARDPQEDQRVWFDGIVKADKKFTVDALNGEKITFTGESISFEVFDLQDTLLQEIEIGISDSQSLIKKDVFGSLLLDKVNYKFKIPKEYELFSQYIVSFNEDVSWGEVVAYAEYWESYGVSIGMELSLINALALKVPDYITPEELADDPRVSTVELNQDLGMKNLLNAQGRSFIRPLDHKPEKYEYPWSVLKLYDQPEDDYSTDSPSGWLAEEAVPELIQFALKQLGKAKLRVAIFDTGISNQHKKVGGRHRGGVDVVSPALEKDGKVTFIEVAPEDNNGHGTHVAGILATMLDEKYKWGEGLKVELYGIKILDQYATGSLSSVVMGLQWAVENDIDIVNMSIGYLRDSPATRKAIQQATEAGLIIVASIGNHSNYDDSVVLNGAGEGGAGEGGAGEGGAGEGGAGEGGAGEGGAGEGGAGEGGAGEGGAGEGGAGEGGAGEGGAGEGGAGEGGAGEGGAGEGGAGEGGAGEGGAGEGGAGEGGATQSLTLYSVMYPARYPEVIGVGASDQWGELAPFSNSGDEMDIMAPGVDILSWDITNEDGKEGYGSTSGTSMAAPHATAAVALMVALDPTLDVQEIRDILKQTAHYGVGSPAGDLNLSGALDEVIFRIVGQDPSTLDPKELEKMYKEKLKDKIDSID